MQLAFLLNLMSEKVARDSPASKAGLQSGDLVLKVDEKRVRTMTDIMESIGATYGKKLELMILRPSSKKVFSLEIITAPESTRYSR